MNENEVKTAKWVLVALLIFTVLAWVYMKMIKPSMDAKREADRKKLTQMVQSAQPDPAKTPAPEVKKVETPATPQRVGIGGIPVN